VPSDWHGRSIYFVVTDRFARSDGDAAAPCEGKGWCGGSLRGLQRKLDYIQGMGFDAIWITPVVKQVDWLDSWNGTGYHGYWAADFSKIDPHFGTEDDLRELRKACTARGMLLMLDIVANHVGPIHNLDHVRQLGAPLNRVSGGEIQQFHQLGRRPGEPFASYVQHPATAVAANCWPNYGPSCNMTVVEQGWFGDLADLRQEDEVTRAYLLSWIKDMVGRYGLDGLRLDTAIYMPRWFLSELQQAAGVYMIGEVVTHNFTFHRSYTPPLQGLLNFPVTGHLPEIFTPGGSLLRLRDLLAQQEASGYPDLHLLGNFIDNHDGDRFLHSQGDLSQVRNGLVWALLHHGIPIVYYGTEQVSVSDRKDMRMSMWPHYGTTDTYRFLAQLNALRRDHGLAAGGRHVAEPARVVSASAQALAFARGELMALLGNGGAGAAAVEVCVEEASLPGRWATACGRAETVLGAGASVRCEHGRLCLRTEGGEPAVFAVSDTWLTWVV